MAIAEKTKEQWAAVLRLRFEGKTFKQIGNILGVSPSRARQLFIRAQREEGRVRTAALFIDWRVSYDYRILVDIIDQIKGLADGQEA